MEHLFDLGYSLWHACIGHFNNEPCEDWDSFALTRVYPIEDEV